LIAHGNYASRQRIRRRITRVIFFFCFFHFFLIRPLLTGRKTGCSEKLHEIIQCVIHSSMIHKLSTIGFRMKSYVQFRCQKLFWSQ
jgi:hypothetical protein